MINGINNIGLYIHFPWCIKKCPYCDFNSHVHHGSIPEQEYISALIDDFNTVLPFLTGKTLCSIFMGGGTPSLFSPASIKSLLTHINTYYPLHDIEITLEANPGTLDQSHLEGYRVAGINRLSIGVQSFDDTSLQELGRIHSAEHAHRALESATLLFPRINIDLMFGLPKQSIVMGLNDLQIACNYNIEHISWYQLTIEAGTHFAKQTPMLPQVEFIEELYEQGLSILTTAGFHQYEISAHTRNKSSTHNVNYWLHGDYIGIGAGAHSKLSFSDRIERWSLWRQPKKYLAHQGLERREWQTIVADKEKLFEYFLNRSRMGAEVTWQEIQLRTGLEISYIKHYLQSCPGVNDFLTLDDNKLIFLPKCMLFNRSFMELLINQHD